MKIGTALHRMPNYRDKIDTSQCYFCETEEGTEVHHIVPQSLGGSDDPENLVSVCSGCHAKLERLYNTRFWNKLGFESPQQTTRSHRECTIKDCVNPAAVKIKNKHNFSIFHCEEHTCYRTEFDRADEIDVVARYSTYELEPTNTDLYDIPEQIIVGPDGLADDPASQSVHEWVEGSEPIDFD